MGSPLMAMPRRNGRRPLAEVATAEIYIATFAFAHVGGNTIVYGVLRESRLNPRRRTWRSTTSSAPRMVVILLLGLVGLWEEVTIVVAVKSIARFEELKERAFAEYFLVGTLTIVLVSTLV